MSHPDPALVDVRTLAGHPLVDDGGPSAPGAATAEGMTAFHARHDQVMVEG